MDPSYDFSPRPVTPIHTPSKHHGLQQDLYESPMSNQSPSSSVVSDSDLGDTETVYSESDCHTEDGEWEPDFVDIQDHSKDDEDYNPRKDDVEMVVNIPAPASRAVSRPSTSTSDDAAVAVKAFATLIMKPTLDLLHVDRQPRFLSALKSRCDFQAYKTDIDDAFDILSMKKDRETSTLRHNLALAAAGGAAPLSHGFDLENM
ncbi:hypothetical protein A4X06_0g7033 [Tilletia controversa]|uniref:Uncharacterized protein n=1 Tax=Tilletia controversa TaxID=13291 RepID=A0A8X7MNJ9_9BASI|nr:hypothetical protein A4X06_0g7033 [Tilletia controversa]